MRRIALAAALLIIIIMGCSSDEQRSPPPSQPAPVEQEPEDDAIVLKGSKDQDAAGKTRTPEEQAKIDELEAQARASQGMDNGQPYREHGVRAAPVKGAPAQKGGKKGGQAPALAVTWVNTVAGPDPTAPGQVIVLEFWSTQNRAARHDLAELQKIANVYASSNPNAVAFAGIHLTANGDGAANVATGEGITYAIGVDQSDQTSVNYGVTGVPTFILIDKKGVIRTKQRQVPTKGAIDVLVNE